MSRRGENRLKKLKVHKNIEFSYSIQNKVAKFVGVCNDIKTALNRCLKQEREENRIKSREKGLKYKRNLQITEKETKTAE